MVVDEKKYWVIAVGKKSFFWDYCKNGNFIVIGWSGLTDLNSVQNLEDLKRIYVNKNWGNNHQAGADCPQIWDFAKTMEKGDLVVVRKGQKKILGIGEIASDHYVDSNKLSSNTIKQYNEDYDGGEYSDIRDVRWFEGIPSEGIDIPKQPSWLKTLMSTKKEDVDTYMNMLKSGSGSNEFNNNIEINLLMKKKQVILYGPPGTGKTFHTKMIASRCILGLEE